MANKTDIDELAAESVPDGREKGGGRFRIARFGLLLPAAIMVALFLFYPLWFIVKLSFTDGNTFLFDPVWTTENYSNMMGRYLPNLLITIKLASLAMIVDLIFAFPFAYILVRKIRYHNLVRGLMVFPLFGALYIAFGMRVALLPDGILGSIIETFGYNSTDVLYSLPSVVFAMAIFTFPFMVLTIATSLTNVNSDLEDAAKILGASPRQTFTRVLLPLTRTGIIAGCLMVFGLSLGTFAEPVFLGTIEEQRSLAWTLFRTGQMQGNYGLSSTMALFLLVIAFAVSFLALRFSRGAILK